MLRAAGAKSAVSQNPSLFTPSAVLKKASSLVRLLNFVSTLGSFLRLGGSLPSSFDSPPLSFNLL